MSTKVRVMTFLLHQVLEQRLDLRLHMAAGAAEIVRIEPHLHLSLSEGRQKDFIGVNRRGYPFEKEETQKKPEDHANTHQGKPRPPEIEQKEKNEDGCKDQTIGAVGLVSDLKGHKVYLHADAQGEHGDMRQVLLQKDQQQEKDRIGEAEILEIDPQKPSLQKSAGRAAKIIKHDNRETRQRQRDIDYLRCAHAHPVTI